MSDNVEIKVSKELIEPVIAAKVQTAIVEALGDKRGVIERMVAEALQAKVKNSQYGYDTVPWIDRVCKDLIQESAKVAIRKWADEQQEKIVAEFVRQLSTKGTARSVVKAMTTGLAEAVACKWRFSVDFPQ